LVQTTVEYEVKSAWFSLLKIITDILYTYLIGVNWVLGAGTDIRILIFCNTRKYTWLVNAITLSYYTLYFK